MKKKFNFKFVLASLGMLLGLTSCKKDWTCSCTFTYDGTSYTEEKVYPGTKRSDAKKSCDAYQTLLKTEYSDASCKIK